MELTFRNGMWSELDAGELLVSTEPPLGATYGEATTLEVQGRWVCALAQFPIDARFSWVETLKATLRRPTLSFRDVAELADAPEHRVSSYGHGGRLGLDDVRRGLRHDVLTGMQQATLFIKDTEPVERDVAGELFRGGVRDPRDGYAARYMKEKVLERFVEVSPVGAIGRMVEERRRPGERSFALTPGGIAGELGYEQDRVLCFAVRADAYAERRQGFAPFEADDWMSAVELLHTGRHFDAKHPETLEPLQRASQAMASAVKRELGPWELRLYLRLLGCTGLTDGVRRGGYVESRPINDGVRRDATRLTTEWAGELLKRGGIREVGRFFFRTVYNGQPRVGGPSLEE